MLKKATTHGENEQKKEAEDSAERPDLTAKIESIAAKMQKTFRHTSTAWRPCGP
jgi:hypothetical protein